jgi:hypothetical protein
VRSSERAAARLRHHPCLQPRIAAASGGGERARANVSRVRVAARGEYLQYLDSDDLLLSHKLELQVAALQERPDAVAAYGRTRYRDTKNVEIACTWKPLLNGETAIFPYFLRGRLWDTLTPLYRASAVAAAGPWTPRRLEEDWEYDCRVAALRLPIVFVPEIAAEVRDSAPDRLSRGRILDADRLRDRAAAHESIFASARLAGIGNDAPEMQHFARALFLLARQCGAAGLTEESRALLVLAAEASEARDVRAYGALSRLFGARATGTLSLFADRLRTIRPARRRR